MEKVNIILENIKKSISPFHGVAVITSILLENGYIRLFEGDNFEIMPNMKYFVVKNDASIIAIKTPNSLDNVYFKIVASHTDSPTFKIKPNGDITCSEYALLNTEVYGGPLLSTWFDRELGIAGRVAVRNNNKITIKLVDLNTKIVIPSIAIHLNRSANEGVKLNPQIDTLPIYSLDKSVCIMNEIAKILNVNEKDILATDLFLYNNDEAKIIGLNSELVLSPRLDDLECVYTSLDAFLNSEVKGNGANVFVAFNHEEVGSSSNHGAGSTFLIDILKRIAKENIYTSLAKSFMVSADNAHAVHPAALSKTDPINNVLMNNGIVIKNNCNLSYTTDAISKSIFKLILDNNKVKYQEFTNRSDVRGGGTLGHISLSHVSIHSVDIGLAQLAMHSANETAGYYDINEMIKGLSAFYNTEIEIKNTEIEIK